MTTPWLEIDLAGFAKTLAAKGLERILLEPVSNALDTKATRIHISFEQEAGWGALTVMDDDPEGFSRLADAWTLYAPSTRAADPTKRGRFGQGEKELIAICAQGGHVSLVSTKGTVTWDRDGRSETKSRIPSGSWLVASFRCNRKQADAFRALVRAIIIPPGIEVTFQDNGGQLDDLWPRQMVRSFTATLPTVKVDEEGNLSDTTRQTKIHLYEPPLGCKPRIYELGVPVVEHDGRFDADVQQKVPLNRDRDNVTPGYLRALTAGILDSSYQDLTSVDFKRGQFADALKTASPDALAVAVHTVYGPDAVIYDPSDREASKRAMDEGRAVVYGRSYSPEVWERIRSEEIMKPAGQVLPSTLTPTLDGEPPIKPEAWTSTMHALAAYTQGMGQRLLGFEPKVQFHNIDVSTGGGHSQAWWGQREITFNLRYLGRAWAEKVDGEELDALLIHEFAHHRVKDHLVDDFHRECCRLGAKLNSGAWASFRAAHVEVTA